MYATETYYQNKIAYYQNKANKLDEVKEFIKYMKLVQNLPSSKYIIEEISRMVEDK